MIPANGSTSGRHQAGRAPGAHARTAGRPAGAAGAAHLAVCDRRADRDGRPVPGRPGAGHRRRAAHGEDVGPHRLGAHPGHDRAGRAERLAYIYVSAHEVEVFVNPNNNDDQTAMSLVFKKFGFIPFPTDVRDEYVLAGRNLAKFIAQF